MHQNQINVSVASHAQRLAGTLPQSHEPFIPELFRIQAAAQRAALNFSVLVVVASRMTGFRPAPMRKKRHYSEKSDDS